MKQFLSCDWGTSSFRLRLINAETLDIIAEESNAGGIATVYDSWQRAEKEGAERLAYYNSIITHHIGLLEKQLSRSLDDIPVIISGMASSTIGMVELPYKRAPFLVDGSDLEIKVLEPGDSFNRRAIIVSGVRTDDDVMRGEETKLIGMNATGNRLYVLPGTHPKHVVAQGKKITGFGTYMTGEYFSLLSTKSILAVSVKAGGSLDEKEHEHSFRRGVEDGVHQNLLHGSFLVRTNALFEKYSPTQNYFYLSGLLIGHELKELVHQKGADISLLGDANMNRIYLLALQTLKIPVAGVEDGDRALIRGQAKIYARFC